jgi:hypothetical protein
MGEGSGARAATRAVQAAILAVFCLGVLRRRPSVAVNAALALCVTLLPGLLERRTDATVAPREAFVVAGAVFLHAVGMVGLYESVRWWDHLTHTLSAAVVATVGYVGARTVEARTPALYLPGVALAGYVLVFTLAAGVVWELLEFLARGVAAATGVEPVLVTYGAADTVLDLVFDAVGAVLAAAYGAWRYGDRT